MSPAVWKLAGVMVLMLLMAGGVWKVQDWRYGKQLAEQAGLHRDDLTAISNAAAAQVSAYQDKRLALEQRLSASEQTHYKELSDAQTNQARLPLLICCCQSSLPRIQPVAAQCQPPPAPAAWVMQPYEPTLTQRMLNELSPSPTKVTGD